MLNYTGTFTYYEVEDAYGQRLIITTYPDGTIIGGKFVDKAMLTATKFGTREHAKEMAKRFEGRAIKIVMTETTEID